MFGNAPIFVPFFGIMRLHACSEFYISQRRTAGSSVSYLHLSWTIVIASPKVAFLATFREHRMQTAEAHIAGYPSAGCTFNTQAVSWPDHTAGKRQSEGRMSLSRGQHELVTLPATHIKYTKYNGAPWL